MSSGCCVDVNGVGRCRDYGMSVTRVNAVARMSAMVMTNSHRRKQQKQSRHRHRRQKDQILPLHQYSRIQGEFSFLPTS